MSESLQSVETIIARLITDKPVRKTPYQVKGLIMRDFSNEGIIPFINGSYRNDFLYPRVQVKILNEQLYFFGIKEGVKPIQNLIDQIKVMNFGNITFKIEGFEVETGNNHFMSSPRMIRYKFLTPWIALNEANLSKYKFLYGNERSSFLTRLLSQNIVFLAKEMGLELHSKIYSKLTLQSPYPKIVDEGKLGAFHGEFQTNFILPNYMGIGNGITKGYGTVFSYFNPSDFSFNVSKLENDFKNKSMEEDLPDDLEENGVSSEDIPKSRRKVSSEVKDTKKNEPNYNTLKYHKRR